MIGENNVIDDESDNDLTEYNNEEKKMQIGIIKMQWKLM